MQFWPLKTKNVKITSFYGLRKNPFTGKIQNHKAIDIGTPIGTPVYCPVSGIVSKTGNSKSLGLFVWVSSGDYKFIFGHLSKISVKSGDKVSSDQPVGLSGASGLITGPHLHFAVYYKNEPIDPLGYSNPSTNKNILFLILPLLLVYTIFKQK